jgi:site-specific DNA recombinase
MKYILYCRKSTDTEDKQALSLDSQEKELLELASKLELNVISVLRESRSAKEPGRPVFNQMLESISNGEADGILCWKIDRLTRNPIDGGKIQWLLQQNCIKAICTPGRTYDPSDNVMLMSIEQAMATQYIRNLSNDVKRGNKTTVHRSDIAMTKLQRNLRFTNKKQNSYHEPSNYTQPGNTPWDRCEKY